MENGEVRWKNFHDYARKILSRSVRSSFFTDEGTMGNKITCLKSITCDFNFCKSHH